MSKGLGRGLDSLIPITQEVQEKIGLPKDGVVEIEVGKIMPNPKQPRYNFDEEALEDLANSIREYGIIQPLIATKKSDGLFELIAGERRLRAAKIVGLKTVPLIIRSYDEQQKLEVAVIENIQRHDLNPLEEAMAYQRLIDDFNLTQEEVSKSVGKSRSSVANTLRLLNLPADIKRGLVEGKITEGHARAILGVDGVENQLSLYEEILNSKLNVRKTESKVKTLTSKEEKENDGYYKEVEGKIRDILETKVCVSGNKKQGKIIIEFYSNEELDRIISKLSE
jgi:ParB family transcriptional regulator, chromosome partitioning protein